MKIFVTILIIAVIMLFVIAGIRETIKHAKGEGACCGGGNIKEDEEPIISLDGPIITRMKIYVDGMHCMNCKNAITRSLQKLDQVSADVNLKENMAYIESTREVRDEEVIFAIERLGFEVAKVERI